MCDAFLQSFFLFLFFFRTYLAEGEEHTICILNAYFYCRTNLPEPFQTLSGSEFPLNPSSLLLAFLPKLGAKSAQPSFSKIPSDCSSQVPRFRSLVNFLRDVTWAWAWCLPWYDIIIHSWLIESLPWHVQQKRLAGGVSGGIHQMPVLGTQGPALLGHCGLIQPHSLPTLFCACYVLRLPGIFAAPLKHCAFMSCVFLMLLLSLENLSPPCPLVKLVSTFRERFSTSTSHQIFSG